MNEEALKTFLRNTRQAWRTVMIPNLLFPPECALPVDEFVDKYRNQAVKDFCRFFSPILEGEFLISFAFENGFFGIARHTWYVVTNQRLVVWDKRTRKHCEFPFNQVADFQIRGSRLIVTRTDGKHIEIKKSLVGYLPPIDMLKTLCDWAPHAPQVVPPAAPTAPPVRLRWYYAQRCSTIASAAAGLSLIILRISQVLWLGFLLVFLVVFSFAIMGVFLGYGYGLFREKIEKIE